MLHVDPLGLARRWKPGRSACGGWLEGRYRFNHVGHPFVESHSGDIGSEIRPGQIAWLAARRGCEPLRRKLLDENLEHLA